MLECKATQGSKDVFGHDVKVARSPKLVCALFRLVALGHESFFDQQQEVLYFYRYNLSEFYVTPDSLPSVRYAKQTTFNHDLFYTCL